RHRRPGWLPRDRGSYAAAGPAPGHSPPGRSREEETALPCGPRWPDWKHLLLLGLLASKPQSASVPVPHGFRFFARTPQLSAGEAAGCSLYRPVVLGQHDGVAGVGSAGVM